MPRFYFDAEMRKLVESHAIKEGLLGLDSIIIPGASTGAVTERSSSILYDHILLATEIVSRPTLIDIGKLGLPDLFKEERSIGSSNIDNAPMPEFSRKILKGNVSQLLDAIPGRNGNFGLIGISAYQPQEISESEWQRVVQLAL